jgi:hypothetical protein
MYEHSHQDDSVHQANRKCTVHQKNREIRRGLRQYYYTKVEASSSRPGRRRGILGHRDIKEGACGRRELVALGIEIINSITSSLEILTYAIEMLD